MSGRASTSSRPCWAHCPSPSVELRTIMRGSCPSSPPPLAALGVGVDDFLALRAPVLPFYSSFPSPPCSSPSPAPSASPAHPSALSCASASFLCMRSHHFPSCSPPLLSSLSRRTPHPHSCPPCSRVLCDHVRLGQQSDWRQSIIVLLPLTYYVADWTATLVTAPGLLTCLDCRVGVWLS